MIERYIRCQHCAATYLWNSYNPSPESSTDYCPECKKAINMALQAISLKFECRYRPISELPQFHVTWEDILAWEEDLRIQRQTSLQPTRVGVGLINLKTGDHQHVRWVRPTSGAHLNKSISFKVSSWGINPEKTIELGMEYDLVKQEFTGEVWRDKKFDA